jgi:hypothetical protein
MITTAGIASWQQLTLYSICAVKQRSTPVVLEIVVACYMWVVVWHWECNMGLHQLLHAHDPPLQFIEVTTS